MIRLQKILHAAPPSHSMGYGSVAVGGVVGGAGGASANGSGSGSGCGGGSGVQVTVGINPNSTASTISRIRRHDHKTNKVSRTARKANQSYLFFNRLFQSFNSSIVQSFKPFSFSVSFMCFSCTFFQSFNRIRF